MPYHPARHARRTGGFRFADRREILRRKNSHGDLDRKSTRLNSSHQIISYAVFCLKKKKKPVITARPRPAPTPVPLRLTTTEATQRPKLLPSTPLSAMHPHQPTLPTSHTPRLPHSP